MEDIVEQFKETYRKLRPQSLWLLGRVVHRIEARN